MTAARRLRRLLAGLLVVGAAAGCAGVVPTPQAPAPPPWPDPDPNRPVVELGFDLAPDLATATGHESVTFRPDQQVCQLVFRAWPNSPGNAGSGTALTVTDARVGGAAVTPVVQAGGAPAGAPGTLVELPLPACVAAGTEVRADLAFTLALGENGERTGHSSADGIAWLATAYPLLAWVRGTGWATDPAVDMSGESATSEEFRLDLTVTADAGQQVLGTGTAAGTATDTTGPAPGRVAHRFTADAVRDVAVSVGRFDVVTRDIGGVTVHVGTPRSGSRTDADAWADELGTQLDRLGALLGPYPYPDLWATIVPALSDGIEFPTALQFGDEPRSRIRSLVAHEVAHQWFYSLVGNDQGRDPWLDESFATWAQAIAADQQDQYQLDDIPDRLSGDLGQPMTFWADRGGFDRYVRGVYDQGAAALLAGRRAVGADRFDAAMRGYLRADAHRVATPADVETAFRDDPAVLDLLSKAGAFG
jgi:Peptidase family M1 domain